MTPWTQREVARAAPDQASLAAARRLAHAGPWSETGGTDALLWGRCQGSGKTPYQVSVDLSGPDAGSARSRCSCPSRKIPCKHALALLLLWVQGEGSVAWLDSSASGSDGPARTPPPYAVPAPASPGRDPAPAVADPAAQARRREERIALMTGGLEDFARWLQDLVRGGTAGARQRGYGWWDQAAARLVDAQLPGLAEQVRGMGEEIHAREDWAEHLLVTLGRWWAATRAWEARDRLSQEQRADLRAVLGWSVPSAEVRERDAVDDTWLVLGAHRSDDGRLQQQRTWVWGETCHETLQVLEFAVVGQPLPTARIVGSVLEATVSRYAGSPPRRALLADPLRMVRRSPALPAGGDVDDALAGAAATWARSPWPTRIPLVLDEVVATDRRVVDVAGRSLPLTGDHDPWLLLALTGGRPSSIFGELEAGRFRPLTVPADGELVPL